MHPYPLWTFLLKTMLSVLHLRESVYERMMYLLNGVIVQHSYWFSKETYEGFERNYSSRPILSHSEAICHQGKKIEILILVFYIILLKLSFSFQNTIHNLNQWWTMDEIFTISLSILCKMKKFSVFYIIGNHMCLITGN